jgi:hypothetical protein
MSLQTMKNKWIKLKIEQYFIEVHHFSSDRFSSPPSTLDAFVNYCEYKNIRGQNARTVERALEVARYVENGVAPNDAIEAAWNNYPWIEV